MHCFICVTYLMIICTAHPPTDRELTKTLVKRSLFHDVIESLRIRAQLPDNINEDNNLERMPDGYGFDNELLQLPRDSEFLPRRNDRIEMPSLKYRLPKSLAISENFESDGTSKEEIVVYVNTPDDTPPTTTLKPKRQKRPRPNSNNKTPNKQVDEGDEPDESTERPFSNNMAGQSQIGNRESQTIVKPTVIVNFRGSVNHRESEIRIERRKIKNETREVLPQNIFNIKQEVKLDKPDAWMGSTGNANKQLPKVKQDLSVPERANLKIEEDMMMCETSGLKQNNNRSSRDQDILQIVVNV